MQWSPQQDAGLKAVDQWFYQESKQKRIYRFFGYAGTGKTSLARHFAANIDGHVAFAAFTGKAALQLQKAGCYGATTIHSLIYKPIVKKDGSVEYQLNAESALHDAKLLVVDECSMVDEELGRDLLSFGKPILVLGDPAQLPPPAGAGFFTNGEPDTMLTEIHRQAEDNPILYLATMVREGNRPTYGEYGESRVLAKGRIADLIEHDQVLVGRNVTRQNMNMKIRQLKEFNDAIPMVGERVICVKNHRPSGIFNGGMFKVNHVFDTPAGSQFMKMTVGSEDVPGMAAPIVKVHKSFFSPEFAKPDWRILKDSQEFEFGYAITCHKSQGSQWGSAFIQDESWCFKEDWNRWLYTAISRGSERITLAIG